MQNIGLYAKALVGSVIAGAGALTTALEDGSVSGTEWTVVGVAVVTAAGFLIGANINIKWAVGTVVAFLGALGAAWEDGSINTQEWVTIAGATFIALSAVWSTPDARTSDALNP